MNGPQHYRAAEGLLETSHRALELATADNANGDTEFAKRLIADAELDLKAAHVHAMLAVAAAHAEPRMTTTSGIGDVYTYSDSHAQAWIQVLA